MADTPVSMTLSAEVAEAVRLRDAARRDGEFTVVKHPFVGTAVFAPHGVGPVAEFLQAASRHVDLIERLHARVRELEDEVAVWQHEYDERK